MGCVHSVGASGLFQFRNLSATLRVWCILRPPSTRPGGCTSRLGCRTYRRMDRPFEPEKVVQMAAAARVHNYGLGNPDPSNLCLNAGGRIPGRRDNTLLFCHSGFLCSDCDQPCQSTRWQVDQCKS